MKKFSHLDENGNVKMVDISDKPITERTAISSAKIKISKETIELINDDKIPKGNVFSIAKIAGIQAAKKTSDLIPLCHQLNISWIVIFHLKSKITIFLLNHLQKQKNNWY